MIILSRRLLKFKSKMEACPVNAESLQICIWLSIFKHLVSRVRFGCKCWLLLILNHARHFFQDFVRCHMKSLCSLCCWDLYIYIAVDRKILDHRPVAGPLYIHEFCSQSESCKIHQVAQIIIPLIHTDCAGEGPHCAFYSKVLVLSMSCQKPF